MEIRSLTIKDNFVIIHWAYHTKLYFLRSVLPFRQDSSKRMESYMIEPFGSQTVSAGNAPAYRLFNGGHQLGIIHFLTVQITDVKDIKHLVHLGGNLGDPDIRSQRNKASVIR